MLWTKNSRAHDQEILEKFFIVNYIPKIEEFVDLDFFQGVLVRILNYQVESKSKSHKSFPIFFLENFVEPKEPNEVERGVV